jgi:DNA-binding transcriptional MerR regulator
VLLAGSNRPRNRLQPQAIYRVTQESRNEVAVLHSNYTHVIWMSMSGGFGSNVVLKLTGVSYRQLDYWARTGLVGSSIRQAAGHGSRRVYSFEDLVALRVVARLLDAGVSLQAVRRAVEYLKRHTELPLSTLALAAKGNRVFVLTGNRAEIIEATAEGQVVIAIDVEPIVKDLRADVTQLSAAREIDVRARGRSYRAVLAPDLEAGGYTIEVPELPGCISEADTLPEARRMAREAVEAWLDAAAPETARRRAHAR